MWATKERMPSLAAVLPLMSIKEPQKVSIQQAVGSSESGSIAAEPFFNKFGWTQGIDYFCNCADNRYNALQTKITRRFTDGWSLLAHYTLQKAEFNDAEQFFFNRRPESGASRF